MKQPPNTWLKPEEIPEDWAEILRQIPGYDPFRDCNGCYFDLEEAEKVIRFFPDCLVHIEGEKAGQPFDLEEWQAAILANLFGWKSRDSLGRWGRRYKVVFLFVPRKNGKTPLAAGIGLYTLFCDPEFGQQNYIAAASKEQAGMLFRQAKEMVRQNPLLKNNSRIYGGTAEAGQNRSIVRENKNSYLRVISADGDTNHGTNSYLILIDELHVQPNRNLVDVLVTSQAGAGRVSPLLVYITTSDLDRPSICNEVYNYAAKVREGILKDQSFLPVIYEASQDDDWTSPETWRKANPNLGVSVSLDYLQREVEKAKENPALESLFRQLHTNVKTQKAGRAINLEKWDLHKPPDPWQWRLEQLERLKKCQCVGGLDLAATSDLNALVLIFQEEKAITLLPWFWCPRISAATRQRQSRVPYLDWIKQGWLIGTEGDCVDYDKIRTDVDNLADDFSIVKIGVDRLFQGAQLCTQLMADGLEVESFGMGFLSMAAPTKEFLELILRGQVYHGSNPILRWMVGHATTKTDPAGNLKFDKETSPEKIDGLVAATIAIGILHKTPIKSKSVYSKRGFLVI